MDSHREAAFVYDRGYWGGTVGSIAVVVALALALMLGIGKAVNGLSFPGYVVRIDQLRSDVESVSAAESEDVIGQVTEANQQIRSMRRYRELWWAKHMLPKGWDDIEVITMPQRGKRDAKAEE